MKNCKGSVTFVVITFIITLCAIGSMISVKYLGPNNEVEEELEEVSEEMAEDELNLPKGSLKPEADLLFGKKKSA